MSKSVDSAACDQNVFLLSWRGRHIIGSNSSTLSIVIVEKCIVDKYLPFCHFQH